MKAWRSFVAISALVAGAQVTPLLAGQTVAEKQTYGYDPLGRLGWVKYSGTVNNGQAHSLCYDAAGNRKRYRSNSAGTLASCTGSGAIGSEFDPGGEIEAPPQFEYPPDVYPESDAPADETPLADMPVNEEAGPEGDGTELPPDPPPPPDGPPVEEEGDIPPVEDPGDPPPGGSGE